VFQITPQTIILIAIFLLIAFPVHEFSSRVRGMAAGRRHGQDVRAG